MKILFVFLSLMAMSNEVEMKTFLRISNNNQNFSAEICGLVKGDNPEKGTIELILDPLGIPRHYQTRANSKGQFCYLVVTLQGEVILKFRKDDAIVFNGEILRLQ